VQSPSHPGKQLLELPLDDAAPAVPFLGHIIPQVYCVFLR
jgi:hypothetical protein